MKIRNTIAKYSSKVMLAVPLSMASLSAFAEGENIDPTAGVTAIGAGTAIIVALAGAALLVHIVLKNSKKAKQAV